MNMRARFGVAVFAGLILGVAIVAAASFTSYGSASPSVMAPAYQSRSVVTASATTTVTSITSAVTTLSTTSQTQPSSAASNFTGSVANTQGTSQHSLFSYSSPAVASQLVTIARQPLQSVVVLLPVLAAVLFGFILYRASRVRTDEEKPIS
jgi:hypothetical protein